MSLGINERTPPPLPPPEVGDEVLTTLDGWQTATIQTVTAGDEVDGAWVVETGDGHAYTSLRGSKVGPQQWCPLRQAADASLFRSWELLALARLTEPTPLFDKLVELARARMARGGLLHEADARTRAPHAAYVLGIIDTATRRLVGVGIYSEDERTITHDGHISYVRLSEAHGDNFHEARELALADLRSRWFEWLGDLREQAR